MQLSLLPREITPVTVLAALQRRIGAANGMTISELAFDITGRQNASDERVLRKVIEQLREEGHAVCATPAAGYHMAANAADLDRTCVFLVRRIESTARKVAAMKRVAMPDLYGQFQLPQPSNDDQQGVTDGNEPSTT